MGRAIVVRLLKSWLLPFTAPGHKHVPDWVWIVVGILNFVAYTLGKKLANAHLAVAGISARLHSLNYHFILCFTHFN